MYVPQIYAQLYNNLSFEDYSLLEWKSYKEDMASFGFLRRNLGYAQAIIKRCPLFELSFVYATSTDRSHVKVYAYTFMATDLHRHLKN